MKSMGEGAARKDQPPLPAPPTLFGPPSIPSFFSYADFSFRDVAASVRLKMNQSAGCRGEAGSESESARELIERVGGSEFEAENESERVYREWE